MLVSFFLQLVTYCSFYWAIIFFFIKKDNVNLKFKLIQVFGSVAIILNLVLCIYNYSDIGIANFIGVFLVSFGLVVFFLAVYASRKQSLYIAFDKENKLNGVLTKGIYGKVRHPFYLSYSLVWVGSPLSSGNIFLVFTLAPLLYLYLLAAQEEEREFLNSSFKDEYAKYMKKTKMFIPFLI